MNVTLNTGEVVYSNPMTSSDALVEYGVETNDAYLSSDAGKRDRFSWLGDRIISSSAIMVSSAQTEYVSNVAEEAFSRQVTSGQVSCNTLFSPLDAESILIRTTNVDPLLVGYDFDFMHLIYDY